MLVVLYTCMYIFINKIYDYFVSFYLLDKFYYPNLDLIQIIFGKRKWEGMEIPRVLRRGKVLLIQFQIGNEVHY